LRLSVVIPSYNGREILPQCLVRLLDTSPRPDVTVVDDGSTDGTVDMLRSDYPDVRLVALPNNAGFSAAVNAGVSATTSDLVMLLNNDVHVSAGLADGLLPAFEDPSVFAVTPRIVLPGMSDIDEGAKTGFWHHGLFFTDQIQGVTAQRPVLYATGCAAVYRRSMLDELGGFDEAYSPFYWEDADLGYRAWKRGWRTLYEPGVVVHHRHSTSISRQPKRFVQTVKSRNSLLFIWRNIEDGRLLRTHRRWLPLVLARRCTAGDIDFLRGWRQACLRRREADAARLADSAHRKLSDRSIFEAVGIKC